MVRRHVYLYPSPGREVEYPKKKRLRTVISNLVKRVFDLMLAFISLILLSPLFALIAILIKRDSPGPVFYRGCRMGKNGHTFKILKFRTMYEAKRSYEGPCVTCKEDDRITPIGRWLRDSKINELPQLWNIIKGEMSFVGPRPEDPEIVKGWHEDAREVILSVSPGLTSPASILYHDEENLLSNSDLMGMYFKDLLPDKVRLDRLYVHNHSFFSDLDVIFWTIIIMVPRLVKTQIPECYLYAGPFSRLFYRNISWFIIDALTSLFAVSITSLIWRSQGPLNLGIINLTLFAVILAFAFGGINALFGLNRIIWSQATSKNAIYLVISSGVITTIIITLNHFGVVSLYLSCSPLPVDMIVAIGLITTIGFTVTRYRSRIITGIASRWVILRQSVASVGERVLIVGTDEGGQIANFLLKRPSIRRAFSVIGMVECFDPQKHGMMVDECKVLGGIGDLPQLVEQYQVGLVLFTILNVSPKLKEYIVNFCNLTDVRIIFFDQLLQDLYNQLAQPIQSASVFEKINVMDEIEK